MIDPVMALGASALGGSTMGLVSNFFHTLIEAKTRNAELLARVDERRNEQIKTYQDGILGKRSPYSLHLLLITCTYCFATAICFLCGDIPVATQGFKGSPTETSILLGLFKRVSPDKDVYLLTFAGLGTYFMSPLAFIQTAVYTGIMPRKN